MRQSISCVCLVFVMNALICFTPSPSDNAVQLLLFSLLHPVASSHHSCLLILLFITSSLSFSAFRSVLAVLLLVHFERLVKCTLFALRDSSWLENSSTVKGSFHIFTALHSAIKHYSFSLMLLKLLVGLRGENSNSCYFYPAFESLSPTFRLCLLLSHLMY
ncbi:hypothetical protein GOODEAATRI_033242 [Goodea atripinnis]|uniref:Secreted protein n=1 Tax=Goodea atripinnis TaxID=208336 RepID=A0ABV0PTR0_9TELE